MSIYAIGDLHLSFAQPKPMDIFGSKWKDHERQLASNWDSLVCSEDTVLVAGDISWAMKLEQAIVDLDWLGQRPGQKVLVRGNHDFWWHREATNRLGRMLAPEMILLHGSSITLGPISVAGTRGYRSEGTEEQSEKIMNRELMFLRRALEALPENSYKIALLHYPPYNQDLQPNAFHELLKLFSVDQVVFGHIHGGEILEGLVDSIRYTCVSADHVDFSPVLVYG